MQICKPDLLAFDRTMDEAKHPHKKEVSTVATKPQANQQPAAAVSILL
jgi:hypothetical protein